VAQFAAFRVENNLTEINHKVSVLAKDFLPAIAPAFAVKCGESFKGLD
jgi:hypothetical protein